MAPFAAALDWLAPANSLGTAYPKGLRQAAVTACADLKVTPARFLDALSPDDHDEIMVDPETARAFAESLARRLA